jgi:glycosyltransferase involved in cell wall biosynthesis
MTKISIVGPVYPYRAGIAYCTTRLAEELAKKHEVEIVSFKRQYPARFYPGSSDIDETLRERSPKKAQFDLDIVRPLTWLKTAWRLRRSRPDAVVFVWWIWVWALPYLMMIALLPRRTKVVLQCHNIGDKEPARWKSWFTNRVLRRGNVLVVHAESELLEASRRAGGRRIVSAQLPVHELGGPPPSREDAKRSLGLSGRNVALFFGHVRPFKGLDIALDAWREIRSDVVLLVAGEAWWESEADHRKRADGLENVRLEFRFIPDSEIANYFAAADVVLAPYRVEAQSGVILTAFHFGRPVIAARVGGIPQIVIEGRNGHLIPPESPGELAQAVDRFFSSPGRDDLEEGARQMARKHSWEDYGNLLSRLVRQP